jgi:hypothetical protein
LPSPNSTRWKAVETKVSNNEGTDTYGGLEPVSQVRLALLEQQRQKGRESGIGQGRLPRSVGGIRRDWKVPAILAVPIGSLEQEPAKMRRATL